MKAPQLLQYIINLPGVDGCFITSRAGEIVGSEMPPLFDVEMLTGIAVNASNVFETFKAEMSECRELKLEAELMILFVRELSNTDLLFITVSQESELQSIRIAANVAAKRYVSSDTEQVEQQTPNTTSLTSTFFETKKPKKKEKPKSGGGGIWG